MKRFRLVAMLLALCVLASVSSCKKEGVYNPSEKIKRVYVSSTYTDKYMSQSWEWDGKLLKSIDHYNSAGDLSWTEDFTYDKKRLVRVDDYLHSEYTTYEYDGKYLKSSNYYDGNSLEATTNYTCENGKLVKMEVTYYGSKSIINDQMKSTYLFLPSEIAETVEKCVAKLHSNNEEKAIETINYQFFWDKDNVIKLVATLNGEIVSLACQYDNKNNPIKGFHNLSTDYDENPVLCFSKNNITKMIATYSDGDNDVMDITYQYNKDNYPTMSIESEGDYQYIIYYEYE